MIELPELNPDTVKNKIIDFMKKIKGESNVKGIAIGLSGGLDSTIVAYLLKEAIGSENILGIHMNSSTTPKEDQKHFKLIAENLNIKYKEIAIDDLSNEFIKLATSSSFENENNWSEKKEYVKSEKIANVSVTGKEHSEYIQKIAEGNLKSRIRMSILYYYANLNNFLVAGTSNRSELLIGYFTKYGDGAGDILPIANIYKTQLKKLAHEWNIPEDIVNKPPSAGLWNEQTDEDEIGFRYEILDRILYLIVDKKLDNDSISKELNISTHEINKIRSRIDNNKHKLQFPLSPVDI
jgi:NAD+ synthase